MYSVVMMMALSGSTAIPDYGCGGRRCSCSCSGYYSCSGCSGRYGCCGGRRARGCRGCYGCCGCCGGAVYNGCRGTMPPAGEKLPRPKKMKNEVSANLVVTLPPQAKLLIDGKATSNNGNASNRVFTTPPLEVGWDYQYTLRAEIMRDGQRRVLTQDVTVRPGQETRVSMTDFTSAQTVGTGSP